MCLNMKILGTMGRNHCQGSKNNRKSSFERGCLVSRWKYKKVKTHAQYMCFFLSYHTRLFHRCTYFSCRL